jgi:hypothetical protein
MTNILITYYVTKVIQCTFCDLNIPEVLYAEYFGVQGKFYGFKVAMLQFLTVILQAFGKLEILGGIVSFAIHEASEHSEVFKRCFWAFVGFLCLNSLYPSILFLFPSKKSVRLGAAMMDAILDMAYTMTYLVITLLAIYELKLDKQVSGNFGDEPAVNFTAELDASFAFPSDFLGYFAVYYSVAHVCTVCRALESYEVQHGMRQPPNPQKRSQRSMHPANSDHFKSCKLICKVL